MYANWVRGVFLRAATNSDSWHSGHNSEVLISPHLREDPAQILRLDHGFALMGDGSDCAPNELDLP